MKWNCGRPEQNLRDERRFASDGGHGLRKILRVGLVHGSGIRIRMFEIRALIQMSAE